MYGKKDIPIWQVLLPFAATAVIVFCAFFAKGDDTPGLGTNEWRKVAWVNEQGQVNCPEVIATVAQQTTNEVKVLIAEEKAQAAMAAARDATNVVKDVAAAIVKNDVRIYRKGALVSFDPFIDWDPEHDHILTCEFKKNDTTCDFGYVATKDIGTTKPLIYEHDTLGDGVPRTDWDTISADDITTPVIHEEEREFAGLTYDKWYSLSIPYVGDNQHFYCIDMNTDTPEGDGMTLEIHGGFTGGFTGTVIDGSLEKTYKGGLLMGVRNVE